MITTEELARIRAIAEADRDGADGKAWDESITPDTVIALCDKAERLEQAILWIAVVAFNGTASDYGSLYGLVEAAHEAVEEGEEPCPKN